MTCHMACGNSCRRSALGTVDKTDCCDAVTGTVDCQTIVTLSVELCDKADCCDTVSGTVDRLL